MVTIWQGSWVVTKPSTLNAVLLGCKQVMGRLNKKPRRAKPDRNPVARLELESTPLLQGPLRLVVIGCLITLSIGITIFLLVSPQKVGDPAPRANPTQLSK